MFDGYGDTINFYRLLSLLDLLCFALVLSHGGSSFAPEYTQQSQKLANYYRAARQHSAQCPPLTPAAHAKRPKIALFRMDGSCCTMSRMSSSDA